jgi:hypothetical protein
MKNKDIAALFAANSKLRGIYKSNLEKLKSNCATVEGLIRTSRRIDNTLIKLESMKGTSDTSNRKIKRHIIIWKQIQKDLFNLLEILLDKIDREEKLDKSTYRYKASFNITIDNISSIKGYSLLQRLGFYNRNTNPDGVVKDHRFSIKSGQLLNIPPEYLGDINNCEFLTYSDNIKKSSNNSVSFDEFCKLTSYCPARGCMHSSR